MLATLTGLKIVLMRKWDVEEGKKPFKDLHSLADLNQLTGTLRIVSKFVIDVVWPIG